MSQAGVITVGAPTTPVTLTGTNGIVITGGPAYNVSDDRFYTKYVVSPTAGEGEFTTIGAAITQAVADGATNTNRKTLLIKYGTYTENVNLTNPGIDIMGIGVPGYRTTNLILEPGQIRYPKIVGNVTFSQTGTNSIAYLTITPATGNCVNCSTAASINFITSCFLDQNVAGASLASISNGTTYFFLCDVVSNSAEAFGIAQSGGTIQSRYCNFSSLGNTTGYNNMTGGSFVDTNSTFDNGFQLAGGNCAFYGSLIGDAGNNSLGCIIMASGNLTINNVTFNNSSSTVSSIAGTGGTLNYVSSIEQNVTDGANILAYSSLTGATISLGTGSVGNLQFTGGFAQTITVATTYPLTLTLNNYYISAQGTGARTITLPAAANRYTGQTFVIKDAAVNSAANNITVSGNGANIIGSSSAATYVINTNGASVMITFNGTAWEVY